MIHRTANGVAAISVFTRMPWHREEGNVAVEVTAVREQHSLMDYLGGAGAVVESFKFES
jgi:hypothetical protein